jgi:hypothetical protein
MRLLKCHPEISCLSEPFHPDHGQYLLRAKDSSTLRIALQEIWTTASGIRHVWDASGWPFPKGSDLNQQLLLNSRHKIVLLNRRNTLRRIISQHISSEARVWSVFDHSDRQKILHYKFNPIVEEWVEYQLSCEKRNIENCRQLLLSSGADFLQLWYEEMYRPSATAQGRIDRLNSVIEFLGYDPIKDADSLARVDELFDGRNTKLNSAETYRLIPGIEAVERKFGSDEAGWLFRDSGLDTA